MFKGVDAINFSKRFPNNEACLRFLAEKKWKNGYQCIRCGCAQYIKGRTSFHRRCGTCDYDESVTANTLFHDMRLPMVKAFYLLFRIATKKKGMSTVELAGEVSVQQKTAWLFKRKIQVAMQGVDIQNLRFDELITALGNNDSQKKSAQSKDREMINPDQHSVKKLGFKGKGVYAMLFKIWLRGIHHKCSRGLFYAYCDEFWFKQRRRSKRAVIFDSSLSKVLLATPHPYAVLKASSG